MCSKPKISGAAAESMALFAFEEIFVCRCSKGRGGKDTVKDAQPDTYVRVSLSYHTKVSIQI